LAKRFSHEQLSLFLTKLMKAFPTRTSLILKEKQERVVQIKFPQEIVNRIAVDFYKRQNFLMSPSASSIKKIGLNQLLSFRPNVSHEIMIVLSLDSFVTFQILTLDVDHDYGIESIISTPIFNIEDQTFFCLHKALKTGKVNKRQADLLKVVFGIEK
jgi:hypothetical protein